MNQEIPLDTREMDELINPGEFTEKELLKLVYRELHRLRTEFDDYKKNNNSQMQLQSLQLEIVKLDNQMQLERKLREEAHKQIKILLAIAGAIFSVVEFVLKVIVK